MNLEDITADVQERFVRYCQIDSGSERGIETINRTPTSAAQLLFMNVLKEDAAAFGEDYYQIDWMPFGLRIRAKATEGYSNVTPFLMGAHVDTTPDAPTKGVRVQTFTNYSGGELLLNGSGYTLTSAEFPELAHFIGDTIFTTDGTTLLGGDDKAGVAALMTFLKYVKENNVAHGEIDIVFTYDEEVGLLGAKKLSKDYTNAKFGYTFDSHFGSLGTESFNAAAAYLTVPSINGEIRGREATIEIAGIYKFPGTAKKEGMIDAFRTLPQVVEYLTANNIKVTYIQKNGDTGCVDLRVILEEDQNLDGLLKIKDKRFRDARADNPVKFKVGEETTAEKYYDLEPVARMVNAIPDDMTAEQTDGRIGYMQPIQFLERDGAWMMYTILRDFDAGLLDEQKRIISQAVPEAKIEDEYQNLADTLKQHPHVTDIARRAMTMAGIDHIEEEPTRGGFEASTYTLNAKIPSANIGALGYGCHTVKEWIPLKALVTAVQSAIYVNELVVARDHKI